MQSNKDNAPAAAKHTGALNTNDKKRETLCRADFSTDASDKLTSNSAIYPWYSSIRDTSPSKFVSLADLAFDAALDDRVGAKNSAPALTPYQAQAKTKDAAIASQYHALVVDHDDDDKTKEEITSLYDQWGVAYFAFTTSSHQQNKHGVIANRWKVVVPLASHIEYEHYEALTVGLALTNNGDMAQTRSQQVFYAPNRISKEAPNDFIDEINKPFVDPHSAAHPLIKACLREYEKHQQTKAEKAPIKPRTSVINTNNNTNIFQKIQQHYDVEQELISRNHKRIGEKYLSPHSTTGMPGIIILQGRDGVKRCYSHHGASDPLSNLNNDGHALDVVDVISILDFGGDVTQTLSKLAAIVDPEGQKQRQREHMQEQDAIKTQQAIDSLINNEASKDESSEPANEPIFDLTQFSLMGMAKEMEAKMLDDKFILGGMAILGQSTVFYAKPNAGKTLLTIWLLIEAIKNGELNGNDVFYINADDNHKGLTQKLKLAEENGFHMLAPGYNGFNASQLNLMLAALVKQDTARGKVLILDTVKKFTDIMDKKVGSAFGESVRQFVAHGGSVIMLAHVNKHRDNDGELIFAGTSDLVDDADCAYTLDEVTEDKLSGDKTVMFANFKSRGDVSKEEVYRYDAGQGVSYSGRLGSVQRVTDDERKDAEKQKKLDSIYEKNLEAIETIKEVIKEGITKKTELINAVVDRTGLTKRKVTKALADHTGSNMAEYQYWHVNVEDKNAHVYKLNWGVF